MPNIRTALIVAGTVPLAFFPTLSYAQATRATATAANAPVPASVLAGKSIFEQMHWRSLGPTNQAGRVSVVVGVPGDPSTYYVSGANGGIIKTTNGGTTFNAIFDRQSAGSIGAIAVAPSDPNVIYVGTGEGNPRNNASVGDGMYKSVDAGEHWTKIGLEKSDKVPRIVIDARNPDLVFACTLGREWGPGEERGVFKTTDGGKSWRRVLFVDPQSGCSDLASDPNNSNILYAGIYTHLRRAWHFESGAGNTAVYKSVDGGEHWTKLSGPSESRGLPKTAMDRIGIAVAPSDPNIVYVISETKDEGELWRSDDAGATWRTVNRDPNINFRPFYYADLRVDPINPNRVFTLSGALYLSEDGGKNFTIVAGDVHGDHQSLWIDPRNAKRILSGSDGGWQVSADAGKTWDVVNTFPFTQFYHINVDMQKPYMMCGGLQDNGNWCGPSLALSARGNQRSDWYTVSSGDGFFTVPDVAKPWLIYSDAQGGMISITDVRTGNIKTIYPYPNRVGSVGDQMLGHKYRFNWNSPIAVSPLQPGVVYFGGNVLFRSRDHGMSWEAISPDLTTNDPKKQGHSGGTIVTDNTAAEFHCTIITIALSPADSNVIWVGTDDGNVQVTRDGGKTWTNVVKNIAGLAPNAWIPTVEASHVDAGTAYIAADHHQDDDYTPFAYMTTDYGRTWRAITGDLPKNAGWAHVVREDPRNRDLLYLGTEMGAWASWDRGAHWMSLRGDMSIVPVRDIQIHPRENDLILATHGRGIYVMDDITPLQKAASAADADAMLFDMRTATRWQYWNKDGNLGFKVWGGENPPYGALISYHLKSAAKAVTITITDRDGRVIRTMKEEPHEEGLTRVNWDLREDGPPPASDDTTSRRRPRRPAGPWKVYENDASLESFMTPGGPAVLPGTYTVTLDVDGKTMSKPVTVELDPRYDIPAADLTAQHTTGRALREVATRAGAVVMGVDDLTKQLTALRAQLAGTPSAANASAPPRASGAALAAIDSALGDLKQFRDSVLTRPTPVMGYRQYPRLMDEINNVSGMVWRGISRPTAGESLRTTELKQETDQAQARLDTIVATRIAKVNELLGGTPHVIAPKKGFVP